MFTLINYNLHFYPLATVHERVVRFQGKVYAYVFLRVYTLVLWPLGFLGL